MKTRYRKIENELNSYSSINLKFKDIKRILNNAKLQALISLGDSDISNLLLKYYLEGASFGALRRVEKDFSYTINKYFMKIKSGYVPWKLK